MTSTYYWDLYVCYVKQCERENYINDIDPNHYQMEWNHFWPKCIFGEWNVGQWLTLRQHAIATALQTIVLKRNCLCRWHKQYLPPALLELAWPYYCEARRKIHEEKDEKGMSLYAVEKCGLPRKAIVVTFSNSTQKKFVSIKEVARFFQCPPRSIRRKIGKGPSYLRGSKFYGICFELSV